MRQKGFIAQQSALRSRCRHSTTRAKVGAIWPLPRLAHLQLLRTHLSGCPAARAPLAPRSPPPLKRCSSLPVHQSGWISPPRRKLEISFGLGSKWLRDVTSPTERPRLCAGQSSAGMCAAAWLVGNTKSAAGSAEDSLAISAAAKLSMCPCERRHESNSVTQNAHIVNSVYWHVH